MGRPEEQRAEYGHEYIADDGGVWPAVTTILDLVRIPALEAWQFRQARHLGEIRGWDAATAGVARDDIHRYPEPSPFDAAGRGSHVHRILADIARQRWNGKHPADVAGYVAAGRLFLNQHVGQVEAVEQFRRGTTPDGHRYAGVADLVADKDGRRVVVDWKVGALRPRYVLQVFAYGAAAAADGDGPNADIGVVVAVSEDGTYDTASVEMADTWWQDLWNTTCDHYSRNADDRYTNAADGSDQLLGVPIRDVRPQPDDTTAEPADAGDTARDESTGDNPVSPRARAA